jgi:hypothetical protein
LENSNSNCNCNGKLQQHLQLQLQLQLQLRGYCSDIHTDLLRVALRFLVLWCTNNSYDRFPDGNFFDFHPDNGDRHRLRQYKMTLRNRMWPVLAHPCYKELSRRRERSAWISEQYPSVVFTAQPDGRTEHASK